MTRRPGWQLLQTPGPGNVPDRVQRAMAAPLIDHRSRDFSKLALDVLGGLAELAGTSEPVALYASSGTGAWHAALVNTLTAGDTVLMCENGFFAAQWGRLAASLGLDVIRLEGDWRLPIEASEVGAALAHDREHAIKAVLLVHNETSTGVRNPVPEIRAALDNADHPALLLVDTISSLASMPYRHDAWRVDVTIRCSQKGLMLPPGLGFTVAGARARKASATAGLPKGYWDWSRALEAAKTGFFPSTPATSLLYGLREALQLIREEGLDRVFERHARLATATRAAVRAWGLETYCADPTAASETVTAVLLAEGHDAEELRHAVHERLGVALGTGLERLRGRVVRIGHLGDLNETMLAGTLSAFELGLSLIGVPHEPGGIAAAIEQLRSAPEKVVAHSSARRSNDGTS